MIGIFDSGLGGLTIMKEIVKKLPKYDYLYLGDTLHVPYGNRSSEAIYDLTRQACDFLFAHDCQLIIVACNTASAKALRRLQQEYLPLQSKNKKILGVIRPVAEYFSEQDYSSVGVIGTRGTIDSKVYNKEIHKLNKQVKIYSQATPLLVPLLEEGFANQPATDLILRDYLKMLKLKHPEALILGCTHYPLLINQIKKNLPQVEIPHPGKIVASKLKDYLIRHPEIEILLSKKKKRQFMVTDKTENFERVAKRFWAQLIKIKQVKY